MSGPARLGQIGIHPLKSAATRPVTRARVTPVSLEGDRHWMVVEPDGTLLSARTEHRLLTVVADTAATDPDLEATPEVALRLQAPGATPVVLTLPRTERVAVTLHRHHLHGLPSPEGSAWLSAVLDRPVTLVWCSDPTERTLNPAYARPGEHTAYADGYPVTVATSASLAQLDTWVRKVAAERGETPTPMTMARFRPNLVVNGDLEPFEEDGWTRVQVGEASFRVVKGVDRCVMTTVDPVTLERGPEPIRTLARHRKRDGATWFAMHLVPEGEGEVRCGDEVVVTR